MTPREELAEVAEESWRDGFKAAMELLTEIPGLRGRVLTRRYIHRLLAATQVGMAGDVAAPPACSLCGGRRYVVEPGKPLRCLGCESSGGSVYRDGTYGDHCDSWKPHDSHDWDDSQGGTWRCQGTWARP